LLDRCRSSVCYNNKATGKSIVLNEWIRCILNHLALTIVIARFLRLKNLVTFSSFVWWITFRILAVRRIRWGAWRIWVWCEGIRARGWGRYVFTAWMNSKTEALLVKVIFANHFGPIAIVKSYLIHLSFKRILRLNRADLRFFKVFLNFWHLSVKPLTLNFMKKLTNTLRSIVLGFTLIFFRRYHSHLDVVHSVIDMLQANSICESIKLPFPWDLCMELNSNVLMVRDGVEQNWGTNRPIPLFERHKVNLMEIVMVPIILILPRNASNPVLFKPCIVFVE